MFTAVFANVPAKFSMSSTGAGCQARLKPMGAKNTTRRKGLSSIRITELK